MFKGDYLARSERFEIPTLRFEVSCSCRSSECLSKSSQRKAGDVPMFLGFARTVSLSKSTEVWRKRALGEQY
jgi:hypothetical protein